MLDRKYVLIFISGVAVGGISTAVLWNCRGKKSQKQEKSVLEAVGNATCWPLTGAKSNVTAIPRTIHIVSDPTEFDTILQTVLDKVNDVKVLGFDCEWTSSDSKANPIALLQFATSDYSCYLLRLNRLNGFLPKEIMNILQNKAILKVGVGVKEDASKLLKDHNIAVQGCLDLRAFAARYQISSARGLKSLAEETVGITLDKSYHLRCSDWDADTLTEQQVNYAALDACSALKIFEALLQRKFVRNPPCMEDINKAAHSVMWTMVRSSVQGLVDMTFKEKKSFQSIKSNDLKDNNNAKGSKGIPKNPKLFKTMKSHSTRQQPLYDNCKLQAPDGQLLSTCDRKKAQWYLEKKLAELICEEPLTIRLYFEPSGRPDDDRDYYLYEKENKCVICGSAESFVRKHIIPHEYRRHFALAMKDHTSHDILLLCLTCHQQSNYYDCLLRRQLAEEYRAPQGSMQAMRMFEDPERRSVRSAGKALQQARNQLPDDRRKELVKLVTDFFQTASISDQLITEASELETRIENEAYVPHGEKVVMSIYKSHGSEGLLDFEMRWRKHFLKNMQPKFLPDLWSIDHNHGKARKKMDEMEAEFKEKLKSSPDAPATTL